MKKKSIKDAFDTECWCHRIIADPYQDGLVAVSIIFVLKIYIAISDTRDTLRSDGNLVGISAPGGDQLTTM